MNAIYITHNTGQFCQGITLIYLDDQKLLSEHYLLLNKVHITEMGIGSNCFNFNDFIVAGVSILIQSSQKRIMTTEIHNSLFKGFHGTAVHIRSNCPTFKNTFVLNACTFHSIFAVNKAVVKAKLSDYNNFISFNNCTFQHNNADKSVISI